MKLTRDEFLKQPRKAVTLIGMSGVGKSHTACILKNLGWVNYSCDYLIAKEYLADVQDQNGVLSEMNISCLSDFVGKIGNPAQGGMDLHEFKRRQQIYYEAECAVMRDMGRALDEAGGENFVNDSAGSLCEIEDEDLMRSLGEKTLFVYLRVEQADHGEILRRAIANPKPLYFPPDFFNERLENYMREFNVGDIEGINPDSFLSWVFPYLFESRLPKYQRLADLHGVTISSKDLGGITSEEDFINVIAGALNEQGSKSRMDPETSSG